MRAHKVILTASSEMLEMKTAIEIEAWITELEEKYCNTDISDVSTTTIEEILDMFDENGN